jgi:hypothetical protein
MALTHKDRTAQAMFGTPDDLTFRSCLTLFRAAATDLEDTLLFEDGLRDSISEHTAAAAQAAASRQVPQGIPHIRIPASLARAIASARCLTRLKIRTVTSFHRYEAGTLPA